MRWGAGRSVLVTLIRLASSSLPPVVTEADSHIVEGVCIAQLAHLCHQPSPMSF
jgi:hypothetical protein